jgi:uncharacterized cupin superfamily protein
MLRINIHAEEFEYDASDPEGYRGGRMRVGAGIGASELGASVYELPPGQAICPYHYELGDEEWLIVLAGEATVRHPQGTELLEAGETVCFEAGAAGAHKVSNQSDQTVRVLLLSSMNMPSVAVYPDSDKIGVFTADGSDDLMVRRSDRVDYWEGER